MFAEAAWILIKVSYHYMRVTESDEEWNLLCYYQSLLVLCV
jgi:hypothetical protein